MRTRSKPWAGRVIRWLCDTWAELAYLQRRLIEGQMDSRSLRMPPERSKAEALEAMWALPARVPDDGLG